MIFANIIFHLSTFTFHLHFTFHLSTFTFHLPFAFHQAQHFARLELHAGRRIDGELLAGDKVGDERCAELGGVPADCGWRLAIQIGQHEDALRPNHGQRVAVAARDDLEVRIRPERRMRRENGV